MQKKFSLSKGQVNFAVYKYPMKQPPANFSLSEEPQPKKSKKRDWIADAYDAAVAYDDKEKDQKGRKGKTFLEWLFG